MNTTTARTILTLAIWPALLMASGPRMELIPASATGRPDTEWFVVPGSRIILLAHPDQVVRAEVYVAEFSPFVIGSYDTTMNCEGYESGSSGRVEPVPGCCYNGIDEDCGFGVDESRPDYIFSGLSALWGCQDVTECNDGQPGAFATGGVALQGGGTDDGELKYGSTWEFALTQDAAGTFHIDFEPLLVDIMAEHLPVKSMPLTIALVDLASPLPDNMLGIACAGSIDCPNTADCVAGTCYAPRHRYVTFDATSLAPEGPVAFRLHRREDGDYTPIGWVGVPDPASIASVEPAPVYLDASSLGTVNVTGDAILHDAEYCIQAIREGDDTSDETRYALPLCLPTVALFGDVAGPLSSPGVASPPDGVVNLEDVLLTVLAFQGQAYAPWTWFDVDGNGQVNLADAQQVALAFTGN